VNAWSLAITTPAGDGRTHQLVETVDAYLSEALSSVSGMPDRVDRLLPGQSREVQLDALPPDSAVRVLAVVFDDNSSVGDPDLIRSIFQRRVTERDELERVVETFSAVLQTSHGLPALEELARRFSAAASEKESIPHRAAREAVGSYMQRATDGNVDQIEQLLRAYAGLVQRQHELAVRHSSQEGTRP
jgi:hypothetical protein